MSRKVYVVDVDMTKFEKPGSKEWDHLGALGSEHVKVLFEEPPTT